MEKEGAINAVFCRTCAIPYLTNVCVRFDSQESAEKNLIEKINVVGLYLQPDDLLPKYICRICIDRLETSVSFINNLQAAQKKLTAMLRAAQNALKQSKNVSFIDIKKEEPFYNENESAIDYLDYGDDSYSDSSETESSSSTSSDTNLATYSRRKMEAKLRRKTNKRIKKEPIISDKEDGVMQEIAKKIAYREAILEADQTWWDYTWECSICKLQFQALDLLRAHSKTEHNQCAKLKCIDCVRPRPPFNKAETFVDHVVRHRPFLKLSCLFCNITFISIHQMNIHKESSHPNFCKVCGEVFNNLKTLEEHTNMYIQAVQLDANGQRKCIHCEKTFKTRKAHYNHLQTHKPRSRDFSCDLCGKAFFSKGALASHLPTHSNERPYSCLICKSDFKTNFGLNRHMILHDKSLEVVCDQCGRNFRNKSQLKGHLRVHTSEANYACTFCEKRFKFMSNLKTHLRQHTGERPFSCQQCNHNFTNHSNYYKHMKRRHNIILAKPKKIM